MAFEKDNLNLMGTLSDSEAPTIYSYYSDVDTLQTMLAANYFNEIAEIFDNGDIIFLKDKTTNTSHFTISVNGSVVTMISKSASFLDKTIIDVSTLHDEYILIPKGGVITSMTGILEAAISGTAATISVYAGTSLDLLGIFTIPTGSGAVGVVNTLTLSSYPVSDGITPVLLECNGASTDPANFSLQIKVEGAGTY
jgi:hypothetical protein